MSFIVTALCIMRLKLASLLAINVLFRKVCKVYKITTIIIEREFFPYVEN